VPNIVSFTDSIAELAHGEKLCTQSITQSFTHSITQSLSNSPSITDVPGTEAFALEQTKLTVLKASILATCSMRVKHG